MKLVLELLRLTRPVLPQMLAGLSLSIFAALSSVALMATAAWLIASAALQPPLYTLSLAIIGVRCFGIARAIFRYGERYTSHDATFRILRRLRVLTYARVAALEAARREEASYGTWADLLLRRIELLKDFYLRILAPLLTALSVTALLAAVFFFCAPRLSLLLIAACFLIGFVIPYALRRKGRRDNAAFEKYKARLTNQCVDAIHGLSELIVWDQTQITRTAIRQTAAKTSERETACFRRQALADALAEMTAAAALLVAFCLLTPLVRTQALSGVDFAALLLALQSGFESALALPALWQHGAAAADAAKALFSLPKPPEKATASQHRLPLTPDAPLLTATRLHFAYPGEPPILSDFSFTLRAGERVGIVGASGTGKSTLLALLLALRAPQRGALLLGDLSYSALDPEEIRAQFNMVAQESHIFQHSIRDHLLLLHPGASENELKEALDKAALRGYIEALPLGLDTPVGQNGAQLSGGQRRRLSLACAFLRPAPLLLLDEPTAGLDPCTAQRVMHAVENLPSRPAILLVTHNIAELCHMDRILVLQNGTVAEAGDYQTLVKQNGLFCRLLQCGQRSNEGCNAGHAPPPL